jgi:hypothetical protein
MALQQAYRGGGRPGWWLRFSYNAELVERLKKTIPHTDRLWSAEAGMWWVHQRWEERLSGLFPDFDAYLQQQSLF